MSQTPQAKVSADAQGLETALYCVYNATKGRRLNSKVTLADSAREPLKILKVLIEGLARDGESSLWLTPLIFTPNVTRLFPFDFAYLDRDLTIIEGSALPPGVLLPQFNSRVASALILPLDTLSSTGTCSGDRLIVCKEEELQARIAEITVGVAFASASASTDTSTSATPTRRPSTDREISETYRAPFNTSNDPLPTFAGFAGPGGQGTASTLMKASGWQISNSTTATVLTETAQPKTPQAQAPDSGHPSPVDKAAPDSEDLKVRAPSVVPCHQAAVNLGVKQTEAQAGSLQKAPDTPQLILEKPPVEMPTIGVPAVEKIEQPRPQPEARPTPPAAAPRVEETKKVPPTARTSEPEREKAKKAPQEKKKESLGVLVKRFLNCEDPLPERRSIIRLLSKDLVAISSPGEKTNPIEVRDVSPTGLYLRTRERWKLGQVVSLVLQRKDAKNDDYESRVGVKVKTVRCDDGGIGLSWIWPPDVEFQPWRRLHTKRSDETDAAYFLRELRLTVALGFLREICPTAVEEIKLALYQRLSNKRVASAVQIALKARELLAERAHREDKLAHLDMVRRILENGSWTEDDWIRQWWAGLLTSSCSPDGLDSSNTVFIDLLAKLTPVHLRVLSFVCRKDAEASSLSDPAAKRDLYCTSDELIEAVGSHSLARIQQTMGQLSSLALLADSSNPSYVSVTDRGKTRIAPTALGLKMHARCHGHR